MIRDVDLSVPGPVTDHNGIFVRIGKQRHPVLVQKLMRVYPVPGCAHATAHSERFASIELAKFQVNETNSVPTSDCLTAQRVVDWQDE